MTLSEKIWAAAAMADRGREDDAYRALDSILKDREQPAWLTEAIRVLQLDEVPRDRPINLKEAA